MKQVTCGEPTKNYHRLGTSPQRQRQPSPDSGPPCDVISEKYVR